MWPARFGAFAFDLHELVDSLIVILRNERACLPAMTSDICTSYVHSALSGHRQSLAGVRVWASRPVEVQYVRAIR